MIYQKEELPGETNKNSLWKLKLNVDIDCRRCYTI